jgi:hypothetical protein
MILKLTVLSQVSPIHIPKTYFSKMKAFFQVAGYCSRCYLHKNLNISLSLLPHIYYTTHNQIFTLYFSVSFLTGKKIMKFEWRAVCKVHGLTLLLQVGTLWRCRDSLFLKVPPLGKWHLLRCSTHFSKTRCRLFAASFRRIVEQVVLTSKLPFHGWKSPEITWGDIWTV